MEIQELRKEFNQLLENINQHSERFTDKKHLPSLEINVMLSKINKLQEVAAVLKFTLELKEEEISQKRKEYRQAQQTVSLNDFAEEPLIAEEPITTNEGSNIEAESAEKEEQTLKLSEEEDLSGQVVEEPTKPITNIEQLPIAKLVDVLSLNDRYLYANELFNKDMGAFNEAVKNIDTCTNFDEAQAFLMGVGTTNNWDVENEHVLSFTNLVERRFL